MLYTPVFKPYKHQKKVGKMLDTASSFALLMGMRTGKTKVTIDDWGTKVLRGDCLNLLVIAPAGVYETWLTQLKDHLPSFLYDACDISIWRSGANKAERDAFERSQVPRANVPRILIVNIEALSFKKNRCEPVVRAFLQSGRTYFAIDESTTIKNPKARRTIAVWDLGTLAVYRRILTGLVSPRSPLDIFAQYFFLDPRILGYTDYSNFEKRYAIRKLMEVGGRKFWVVVGYKNLEELADRIAKHSFRIQLRDCSDTPPKLYIERSVELTDEQKKHYKDLKRKMTTQLTSGEHVTTTEKIVQLLRLHQLCCGHLVDEDGTTHPVASNRIATLLEIIEEYEGKVIIWASYAHDILAISEALREAYGDASVAQFWGGNKKTREADSHRFKTDPDCYFMVATPGAGGRGRTWSEADLLIFYSNTDNLEHRDQAEERGSGVDKLDRVTVIDMIAKGTIETKIVKNLRNKINMAGQMMGDRLREWLI